jgi:hypothetical protein
LGYDAPPKAGKNTCKIQVLINTDRAVAFIPGMINLNLSPFNRDTKNPKWRAMPMAEKMSDKDSICFERCYFEAKNCRQNDDGTWDCSSSPRFCEEHCRD